MKDERKFIKSALDSLPPPEVSDDEWREVWSGVLRDTEEIPVPRKRWKAFQVAVVFAAGLLIGVFGSRLGARQPSIEPAIPSPSTESTIGLEGEKSQEKAGAQFCGLSNVQFRELDESLDGRKIYQMDGETENGVRVVMTYPEWKDNYNGGI